MGCTLFTTLRVQKYLWSCDIRYTKKLELEAVSKLKKLMICGSLHGPGQIYGGGSFCYWVDITLAGEIAQII